MLNGEKKIAKPYRWAMIGGGRTGGVGYKHRLGALRDNTAFELVAGAFDIDPERGKDLGVNLGVDPDRCYPDYQTMLKEEAKREDGIQVVSIATPNATHFEITKAVLEAGLHVVCEKPLFFEEEEGEIIRELAKKQNKIVGVTFGFSGNPMLLQMRSMVENGELGDIHMVELQYTHGYACDELGDTNTPSQKWRVDPKIAGRTFVLGDLSTHTFYMSQLILPNMKIEKLLCDRQSFVKSRAPLEDNAYVIMHYKNGAVGRMWTSAVDAGRMDGHRIRIVGSKASVEYNDALGNQLRYEVQGEPSRILWRGTDYLSDDCLAYERLGVLHQEGLAEAWSNIYLKFAIAMDAKDRGDQETLDNLVYPDLDHGIEAIRWVNRCAESADKGSVWVNWD